MGPLDRLAVASNYPTDIPKISCVKLNWVISNIICTVYRTPSWRSLPYNLYPEAPCKSFRLYLVPHLLQLLRFPGSSFFHFFVNKLWRNCVIITLRMTCTSGRPSSSILAEGHWIRLLTLFPGSCSTKWSINNNSRHFGVLSFGRIRIRISDPRSLRSLRTKGTELWFVSIRSFSYLDNRRKKR